MVGKPKKCRLCPRMCGVARDAGGKRGACGCGAEIRLARAASHAFEEPVIGGRNGTGALFFSGCTLSCAYCQNKTISRDPSSGETVSGERLTDIINALVADGAESVSFITATPYVDALLPVLKRYKAAAAGRNDAPPLVYNTSGYERAETLRKLDGLIDVYLPDFKYWDDGYAVEYSRAPRYRETATAAIDEMLRQTGAPVIRNGILRRGVLLRHLVLPSLRADSEKIIRFISERYGGKILFSLMRQYTPEFCDDAFPELKRRVTSYEYEGLRALAANLGLNGFSQGKSSADARFTPDF